MATTLLALVTLVGCSVSAEAPRPALDEDLAPPPGLAAPTPPIPEGEFSAEPVQVAAHGTTFSPPVAMAAIPDGAWICDMGFVHYAALEQGDGKCPVCAMTLTRKPAHPDHDEGSAAAGGD